MQALHFNLWDKKKEFRILVVLASANQPMLSLHLGILLFVAEVVLP